MNAYYAIVEGYDPSGHDRVADGEEYGGEARVFVVPDVSFSKALRYFLEVVAGNGFELRRLIAAGPAEEFVAEDFPFPVDLEAMVADALESSKICVTPDYAFAPDDVETSGVTLGFADLFDPGRVSKDQPYGGEIASFAVKTTVPLSIEALLLACEAENVLVKGLDEVNDAVFANEEVVEGLLAVEDNKTALEAGRLCWGDIHAYEHECD